MQPTNIPQQPNPIQLAMQNQQPNAAQQLQQQTQQADAQQQAEQQQAGMIKDSAAIDLQQQSATISKALAQLNPKADSGNKTFDTASKVGQATSANPGWANLCEAFAEQQTLGHQGVHPTAYAAYQANAQAGNINTSSTNIPKGAQIFFDKNAGNGNNGHTMVSIGGGKFQGPLQNGNIGTFTLPEWEKYSGGQKYLGYTMPSKK